ncbi:MAG: LOG family protein [Alphaproteobacteria bacterium]|nr:LOG family protein [Alphaproteobacteria bacterium]
MANNDRSSDQNPYRAPKAYRNEKFLDSPEARSLRLLSEYIEPLERFEHYGIQDTILFFGSARILSQEEAETALKAAKRKKEGIERAETALGMAKYYEATRDLARRITTWSKGLKGSGPRFVVCSGGGPGIMEAANRGASEAKGDNIGLGISLPFEQSGNEYITHKLTFEFHYFFMRKFWFLYMAKAMVIMPGGFGTMDELFESLTLMQTGKMKKHMPIVLFGTDFWDAVMDLDAMAKFGTISEDDVGRLFRTNSVDEAFDYITGELAGEALDKPGGYL